jgi:hypothetical protein
LETVSVTPSAPATQTDKPPSTQPPSVTQPRVSKSSLPQLGVVPDVMGMNHQLAQDTMQAAGFFNLAEEDATGQGRLLISDRNWVVVTQLPKGGTRAASDTTIILRSKKIGE